MMKTWAALFVLALGCGEGDKIYPITEESHHHLVMQDDRVRVFDVHVAPHSETGIHTHNYDYIYVTLGPAKVVSHVYHDSSHALTLSDGEVRYTKAPLVHSAINNGDTPFHNVTIELLHPATHVAPCTLPCTLTSDQWTVYSLTVPPADSVNAHDALVVAVSPVNLIEDGPSLTGNPGALARLHGPLRNGGPGDARVVVLEFH
jgi:quercetin dioxygenase-like cupin family protein